MCEFIENTDEMLMLYHNRPRAALPHTQKQEVDSPSILRKTENYMWTPRDTTVDAVKQHILFTAILIKILGS